MRGAFSCHLLNRVGREPGPAGRVDTLWMDGHVRNSVGRWSPRFELVASSVERASVQVTEMMFTKRSFAGVAGVWCLAIASQGCDVQSFKLTVRNDTGSAVILRQCSASPWDKLVLRRSPCDVLEERIHLDPGQTTGASTAVSATNWYRVEDARGGLQGCLALRFDHRDPAAVVGVSAKQSCP
jgi:hypothetical protein